MSSRAPSLAQGSERHKAEPVRHRRVATARQAGTALALHARSLQPFPDISRLVSFLRGVRRIASIIALILYRYEIVPGWVPFAAVVIDVATALAALALILTIARETRLGRLDAGTHDTKQ
jgi:hypothetical protein